MNIKHIEKIYWREIEEDYQKGKIEAFIKHTGYHPNLSTLAIRGHRLGEYPKYYYEEIGNVLKVRKILSPPTNSKILRGNITRLSEKSRKRLLEFLISIPWENYDPDQVREVTLTYHENYPDNGKEVKRQLDNFRRDIMRKYPKSIFIWKLEYQKRGAPHFHIILITKKVEELGDYQVIKDGEIYFFDRVEKKRIEVGERGLRAFVQEKWSHHTKDSIEQFNSGIEVEEVRKKESIAFYLCKYIAKDRKATKKEYQHEVPEWFKNCGRWWGCYNKKLLNIRKKRVKLNNEYEVDEMIEQVKQYWKDNGLPEYKVNEWGVNLYRISK